MTKFVSKPIPDNTQVQREFQRVAEAFSTVHDFDVLHAAPAKPRAGMVRYADGTDWNPGSGEGLYLYTSSGWTKL